MKTAFPILLLLLAFLSCKEENKKAEVTEAQPKKPNIIFIMSDDHAFQAISAYNHPVSQLAPTPNIDRIAKEGIIFTDHYAQPSSTEGRAAFITGQHPIRSAMTTVAMPGGSLGLKKESPSLAEELKKLVMLLGSLGRIT